jgi:hypothetical protein
VNPELATRLAANFGFTALVPETPLHFDGRCGPNPVEKQSRKSPKVTGTPTSRGCLILQQRIPQT